MVYIITGGPGFGKTSLLDCLAEIGYEVCPEIAGNLLFQYRQRRAYDEPDFPPNFEREVACERLKFLQNIPEGRIAFADRGLPDQVAYSLYKKKFPSDWISSLVHEHRYAPIVFVTPPWKEIFVNDPIRIETFEEALAIHQQIVAVYTSLSYKIVNLPLTKREDRVRFIRNFLDI